MPFLGVDSWRWQYFEGQPCPDHVVVPIDDATAWDAHPEFRHIYNKLFICDSQGLPNGPHGTTPPVFPVFSKPIYNMRGMGTGSRIIASAEDYEMALQPGHLWMPLLEGAHVSTDMALAEGEIVWNRHTTGIAGGEGTFDYWTIHAEPQPEIEARCGAWVREHLAGYTGMLNLETIGGAIIEVHLRFADQWPDLYGGRRWVEAVIRLYETGRWQFDDSARHDGYSVVLFGPHEAAYRHPPSGLVEEIARTPGVSSIQITFHENKPGEHHSMPPGG
ncbi:MAG: hypothetical protein JO010_13020, partial [Alphaproteobacteria bacterium]|nr:hypothetical protein [Alphaproteobacteria bacterium]